MVDREPLYTRQQIAEMTGVSDGVLSFWIKNDVLIASEGGGRKGVHRRFDKYEVTYAGILSQMQRHGINVAALRSFSALLRRGRVLWLSSGLKADDLWLTCQASEALLKFNSSDGYKVRRKDLTQKQIYKYAQEGDEEAIFYSASSEEEALYDRFLRDVELTEPMVEFARTLAEADHLPLMLMRGLAGQIEDYDGAPLIWAISQACDGTWSVAQSYERSGNGLELPSTIFSAIWLNVDAIVTRTWSFDNQARLAAYKARNRAILEEEAKTRPQTAQYIEIMKERGQW